MEVFPKLAANGTDVVVEVPGRRFVHNLKGLALRYSITARKLGEVSWIVQFRAPAFCVYDDYTRAFACTTLLAKIEDCYYEEKSCRRGAVAYKHPWYIYLDKRHTVSYYGVYPTAFEYCYDYKAEGEVLQAVKESLRNVQSGIWTVEGRFGARIFDKNVTIIHTAWGKLLYLGGKIYPLDGFEQIKEETVKVLEDSKYADAECDEACRAEALRLLLKL